MLKIITKKEYWDIEDSGILENLPNKFKWHLKSIQDAVAFKYLYPLENQKIAEVGGGDSRILEYLYNKNECYNIDYFEGADGGPKGEVKIEKVRNIIAHLGEFSDQLQSDYFDVIFSVSVVEHVPYPNLDDFYKDCHRILKPGGKMIHLIDAYIEEDDNTYLVGRTKKYKSVFENGLFEAQGDLDIIENNKIHFKCDYASNPDSMMQVWNKSAPHLREKREKSQSVTILQLAVKK